MISNNKVPMNTNIKHASPLDQQPLIDLYVRVGGHDERPLAEQHVRSAFTEIGEDAVGDPIMTLILHPE